MPRGPGKKENYNLDYSRFNGVGNEADEHSVRLATKAAAEANEDEADMPPMEEVLRNMPPELREAYRLMAISRETGDEAAQRRANELALLSVQNGSPEVQRGFLRQVRRMDPDAADILSQDLKSSAPLEPEEKVQDVSRKIDRLRKQMEEGAAATRQQLDALQAQQEQLLRLQSPEDILKFMHQGGLNDDDLRRIFSGDQEHMEKCIGGIIDKQASVEVAPRVDAQKAIETAEELYETVCGKASTKETSVAPHKAVAASSTPAFKPMQLEPRDEVTIPDYRLQYHKDEEGRHSEVQLTCSLPGVADMSCIALDVSEKHLRLSTLAPAPRFAVNAGPFPVLIDPSGARAKYSKKRQELSVHVPAKASR